MEVVKSGGGDLGLQVMVDEVVFGGREGLRGACGREGLHGGCANCAWWLSLKLLLLGFSLILKILKHHILNCKFQNVCETYNNRGLNDWTPMDRFEFGPPYNNPPL